MSLTVPYSMFAEGDAFSNSVAQALESFRKGVEEEIQKKDDFIRQLQNRNQGDQLEIAKLRAKLATALERKIVHDEEVIEVLSLSHDIEGNEDDDNAMAKKDKDKVPDGKVSFPKYEEADHKDETTIPYKDYAQLACKLNDVSHNLNVVDHVRNHNEKRAKHYKELAKQWKDYAEKLEERAAKTALPQSLLKRPITLTPDLSSSRPSTVEPENDIRRTLFTKVLKSPLHTAETPTSHEPTKKEANTAPRSEPVLPEIEQSNHLSTIEKRVDKSQSEIPSSSQTTESETQHISSDNIHGPPSSPPVFISEKVLKRKRGQPAPTPITKRPHQTGTPTELVKIKSEPHSSPQKPLVARKLNRVETLDLDEVSDRIDTPRKRLRMQKLLRQNESFKTEAGSAHTFEYLARESLVVEGEPFDRPISLEAELENLHPVNTTNIALILDGHEWSETSIVNLPRHRADEPVPLRPQPTSVLRPISTNHKILPRTSNIEDKRGRRDPERGANALHAVAEDGNHSTQIAKPRSPRQRNGADNRLGHLLEEPAPTRKQLRSPASTTHRRLYHGAIQEEISTSLTDRLSRDTSKANQLLTPKTETSQPMESPKLLSGSRPGAGQRTENGRTPMRCRPYAPANGLSSRPPLRNKPIDALNIDDFKLNTKVHGGLDLAYADPIRGQARRHLAGCTDPNCAQCGDQLRALAADLSVTVGSALFASTQDADLTEEERLLKYYLGDTFDRERLKLMQPQRRAELVLQAKTKLIAERHARHRVKPMGRAKSPPGFWDYDMPTTQELDAQREEADEIQKVVIEERYREAMRPGGRWSFRDE